MSDMAPPFLTSTQAAELLGVSRETIQRWAEDGHIPGWRTPGGHWRFTRENVEKLTEPQNAA